MFSVANNDPPAAKVISPTISEIAHAVPKGPALQMAETNLTAHRRQREVIGAELTAACEARRNPRGGGPFADIKMLTAEIGAIEEKIKPARQKTMELRHARAHKVAAALAPVRLDAARRLIAAAEELNRAFSDLREICEQIRYAGDADQPHFHSPAIGLALDHALRIAERAK
jgi:hypothetical protein